MNEDGGRIQSGLLGHVLVPAANDEDARAKALSLASYQPSGITHLHIIEKGDGVPDRTPVVQSREEAEAAFSALKETFPEASEHICPGHPTTIFDTAEEVGASATVYRSPVEDD